MTKTGSQVSWQTRRNRGNKKKRLGRKGGGGGGGVLHGTKVDRRPRVGKFKGLKEGANNNAKPMGKRGLGSAKGKSQERGDEGGGENQLRTWHESKLEN